MTFKRGMRRLAFLLGVVGALIGCFVSYLEFDQILGKRERYKQFERLANSQVVRNERARFSKDFIPASSQLNQDGIDTIVWNRDTTVYEIQTTEGEYFHATDAPSFGEYLFGISAPFIGFLLPWIVMMALIWVGSGFFPESPTVTQ